MLPPKMRRAAPILATRKSPAHIGVPADVKLWRENAFPAGGGLSLEPLRIDPGVERQADGME